MERMIKDADVAHYREQGNWISSQILGELHIGGLKNSSWKSVSGGLQSGREALCLEGGTGQFSPLLRFSCFWAKRHERAATLSSRPPDAKLTFQIQSDINHYERNDCTNKNDKGQKS